MELNEQAVDALRISQRINLYLLDAIPDSHLADKAGGKGRSVGETFAHLHNVRMMWLGAAAPALLAGLEKIEKENAHNKQLLRDSLTASGMAMEKLLELGLNDGRIKNLSPTPWLSLAILQRMKPTTAGRYCWP